MAVFMGVDTVVRHKDGRPLGDSVQIIERLTGVFPGVTFVQNPDNGMWSGSFEQDGLAISFYFDGSSVPVPYVAICMYGRIDKLGTYINRLGDWKIVPPYPYQ
jgi:hypothetical protein